VKHGDGSGCGAKGLGFPCLCKLQSCGPLTRSNSRLLQLQLAFLRSRQSYRGGGYLRNVGAKLPALVSCSCWKRKENGLRAFLAGFPRHSCRISVAGLTQLTASLHSSTLMGGWVAPASCRRCRCEISPLEHHRRLQLVPPCGFLRRPLGGLHFPSRQFSRTPFPPFNRKSSIPTGIALGSCSMARSRTAAAHQHFT
jgi:hypothetical protein